MSLPFLVFFVCAGIAVLGALLLILAKEPIHSALALVLVMISLAVLYLLLGAEFIAAVQIIVYAGAIMVLFVFVIMLLNAGSEERTDWSKMAKYAGLPLGYCWNWGTGCSTRRSAKRLPMARSPLLLPFPPWKCRKCFSISTCFRSRPRPS